MNAPAARVLDCFQSALLRIEQGLGTWTNIRDTARSDIACLEHLMVEVQQGRLDLSLPPNLPIPKPPWRNIRPMRSRYIYPFNANGQHDTSSEGSDVAMSPTDIIPGSDLPPAAIVPESMYPIPIVTDFFAPPGQPTDTSSDKIAILTDSSPPPGQPTHVSPSDNGKEEYYPSPVSSTGLDWEFSQDGSDHESSIDFAMSEHSEDASIPSSGSE